MHDLDPKGLEAAPPMTTEAQTKALVERYSLVAYEHDDRLDPRPTGEWVRYVDHAARIEALEADNARLEKERDEADRRAGSAERSLEAEKDATFRRNQWLRKAKEARGYSDDVSFDVVWKDTCDKADRAEAQLAIRPVEAGAVARDIGEAIIDASDATYQTLAIDSKVLVLGPINGVVRIDLVKLRAALATPPASLPAAGVTEAMVEAAESAVYPRHERGFLMKPLIGAIDMRKALEAALAAAPLPPSSGRG